MGNRFSRRELGMSQGCIPIRTDQEDKSYRIPIKRFAAVTTDRKPIMTKFADASHKHTTSMRICQTRVPSGLNPALRLSRTLSNQEIARALSIDTIAR